MSTKFRRCVGAAADVKELEYLSALHQTGTTLRQDGTVSSLDVVRFLKSRVGIILTKQEGIDIVQGLGGGLVSEDVITRILSEMGDPHDYEARAKKQIKQRSDKKASSSSSLSPKMPSKYRSLSSSSSFDKDADDVEEDVSNDSGQQDIQKEYLDIVQLMSIILIPTLARAAQEKQTSKEEEAARETAPKGRWAAKKQERKDEFNDSLKPKPEGLIGNVLDAMLQSIHQQRNDAPPVNAQLVRSLLEIHGESERAADAVLVDRMVEAAGGEGALLDEETFTRVLTSDLKEWDVGIEDGNTTTFHDVWGFDSYHERKKQVEKAKKLAENAKPRDERVGSDSLSGDIGKDDDDSRGKGTEVGNGEYKMNHLRTVFAFDSATDTYASTTLAVAIFVLFICTSLVYAMLFQQIPALDPDCGDDFGCTLLSKIITWLVFAVFLSCVGYIIIIPLSMGNNVVMRSPVLTFAAFILAVVYTILPMITIRSFRNQSDPVDTQPEETVTSPEYYGAQILTCGLGGICCIIIFYDFLLALFSNCDLHSKLLVTSAARGGGRTKRAATRKINGLLDNASSLQVGSSPDSAHSRTDEVMINFVMRGETFEKCGGLWWTWKQIVTKRIFEQEGIWIMSRLIIIQVMQAIFIGFAIYALTVFIAQAVRWSESRQADLAASPDYPQWVYDIVPTPEQVEYALWPAFSVAVCVLFILFFCYLPSYMRIILELRTGIIPSLKGDLFPSYRVAVDSVYTNIGNALYAMLGSSVLFFFLVSLVIFLFIWPFSRSFMILLLAWGLGLLITILIKMAVTMIWRAAFYKGFYRTRPKKANWTQLALECWFLGLGGGVLVGRFTQFILAACFFVGRIDVPFLSKHVTLLGYVFDFAPQNFVKDILVHEAHRHPYMERLLAMYMMKLKHGERFASEAGSCWRQLFVVVFMPWLVKFRVFQDERLGDALEEYNVLRSGGNAPLQPRQVKGTRLVTNQPPTSVSSINQTAPTPPLRLPSDAEGIEVQRREDIFASF